MKLNRRQLRRLIESTLNENQELLGKEIGLGRGESKYEKAPFRHIINKLKEDFVSQYESNNGQRTLSYFDNVDFRDGGPSYKSLARSARSSADAAYLDVSFEKFNAYPARRENLERMYKEIRNNISKMGFRVDGLPVYDTSNMKSGTTKLDKPVTIVLEPADDKIRIQDTTGRDGKEKRYFHYIFKMKIYAQK